MDILHARQGLRSGLLMGIWAYLVLLVSMALSNSTFSAGVWFNRIFTLVLFLWFQHRQRSGQIADRYVSRATLAFCIWTLSSLAYSYTQGASPSVTLRITFLMIISGVLGLPRLAHRIYLGLCLAVCAYLQIYHPSPSNPGLQLTFPLVGALGSLQTYATREHTRRQLAQASARLQEQGDALQETLNCASLRQADLDADVLHATRDLEATNNQLKATIDEQIRAFEETQRLHQAMSESLCQQAIGRAAGAAAHDFNNLLGVISGTLELCESELLQDPDGLRAYQLLRQELDQSMPVGRQVLAVSGKQFLHQESFLLQQALPGWTREWAQCYAPLHSLRLTWEADDVSVCCDQQQLKHILAQVVFNAVEAMPQGGEVVIRVQSGVVVSVEDRGPGVPAAHQKDLFQPFFTTRPGLDHSGLSLAAARAILRQQSCDIDYADRPGGGACFRLRLAPGKVPS